MQLNRRKKNMKKTFLELCIRKWQHNDEKIFLSAVKQGSKESIKYSKRKGTNIKASLFYKKVFLYDFQKWILIRGLKRRNVLSRFLKYSIFIRKELYFYFTLISIFFILRHSKECYSVLVICNIYVMISISFIIIFL